VNTVWQEATATLRPRPDSADGPLPPLLLTLTVVTGLVDATSYLKLGHVFVANMTGNVVFLGFGIAGAGGISVWASRRSAHFSSEVSSGAGPAPAGRATALATSPSLLAVAMGVQNTAARKLAVPDLTTTVLTMTLTGIAADAALAGGHGSKLGRRALSVVAMLLGASIGGLFVLKVDNPAPLVLAVGLLAIVSLFTYRASRSTPAWARNPMRSSAGQ
jgi:uncharacterized membrane protein YoaK (UPF0700 family)